MRSTTRISGGKLGEGIGGRFLKVITDLLSILADVVLYLAWHFLFAWSWAIKLFDINMFNGVFNVAIAF